MAIKAFELFGDVELRTAKLRSGVRDANKEFTVLERHAKSSLKGVETEMNRLGRFKQNFGQGFLAGFGIQRGEGLGSLLGSGAANLLQSGAKAAFGHVTDAIDKGMQMKDLIEQMRIAFTNLTGSEETAVKHMREIFKMGADTPFKTRDLLLYSQQLQAVGVGWRDVRQELTDLGDGMAKAGTFDRMDKAILAITQMRSKGKITAEEMNQQLSEALPGARGYLARGLGVSQPELNELMSEGRLNADASLRLMFMQMRKEAGGTMKEVATKTLAGLQSTLEDTQEILYARAVAGGDPFDAADGAYAQRRKNLMTQIGLYGGPESAGIAKKIGGTAETYYGVVGGLEERMFQSDWFTDLLHGNPEGAKQKLQALAGMIPQGFTDGIAAATTKVVNTASNVLGLNIWEGLESFWETKSPSKRSARLGEWIAEGLEMGLNKKQAGNYAKLQSLSQQDPEFVKKLVSGSVQRGINPDHMLNVLAMESSFNAQADNPNSSAYGLIQFMAGTRKGLGVTQTQLSKMNETEQLDWVFKYFDQPHLKGKLGTQSALYAAVAAGKVGSSDASVLFRKGSAGYNANKVWDANRDGMIQQGELGRVAYGALGAGGAFSIGGRPLSDSNPMPVRLSAFAGVSAAAGGRASFMVDAGNAVAIDPRTMMPVKDQKGGAHLALGRKPISQDPISAMVEVQTAIEPLTTDLGELAQSMTLNLHPLRDLNEEMKKSAAIDDEMARLRKEAIKPEEEKKRKRDPLFDKAFTREGVAGDFQGGFASMLGNLGWGGSPLSLGKQFLFGLARDIQGRIANDISSMMTGALFGSRNEEGKLSGGVLGGGFNLGSIFSKLFGGLFGGGRASGGSVSAGRLYMVGENGPELFAPGAGGQIYNNQQSRMMGGEQRTIVYFGPDEIGRAVGDYGLTTKGRRTRVIQARWMRKLQHVSYT